MNFSSSVMTGMGISLGNLEVVTDYLYANSDMYEPELTEIKTTISHKPCRPSIKVKPVKPKVSTQSIIKKFSLIPNNAVKNIDNDEVLDTVGVSVIQSEDFDFSFDDLKTKKEEREESTMMANNLLSRLNNTQQESIEVEDESDYIDLDDSEDIIIDESEDISIDEIEDTSVDESDDNDDFGLDDIGLDDEDSYEEEEEDDFGIDDIELNDEEDIDAEENEDDEEDKDDEEDEDDDLDLEKLAKKAEAKRKQLEEEQARQKRLEEERQRQIEEEKQKQLEMDTEEEDEDEFDGLDDYFGDTDEDDNDEDENNDDIDIDLGDDNDIDLDLDGEDEIDYDIEEDEPLAKDNKVVQNNKVAEQTKSVNVQQNNDIKTTQSSGPSEIELRMLEQIKQLEARNQQMEEQLQRLSRVNTQTSASSVVDKDFKEKSKVKDIPKRPIEKVVNTEDKPQTDYERYSSMQIDSLYKEVREFMVKLGVERSTIDINKLIQKFGQINIKKLIDKSYIIKIGKGVTIGR